jgi:phage baseplate assembly protein W
MNNSLNDFLGTGWKFPIEFSLETASVVLVDGEESIKNSLDVLFSTPMGERLMHADYGSELHSFVFEEVTKSTITYMQVVIGDAILFNEPRIVLNAINIEPSPNDPAFLKIEVDYTISSTNNRYNYVYPFYLQEATNLFK